MFGGRRSYFLVIYELSNMIDSIRGEDEPVSSSFFEQAKA